MKKLSILLLLSVGIALISYSQPTLTSSIIPAAGTGVTSYEADTTGIQQGPDGENVTWNFSNLVIDQNNPITTFYVAPSATPYASSFPESNLANAQGGGAYEYFKTESDKYSSLGYASEQSNMIYTDPMIYMSFPFTYNTQFNDAFEGSGTAGGITMENAGSILTRGDAYGTLVLPSGTYNNVLRVKTIMVYTSTFFGVVTNITMHSYAWYNGNTSYPLMSLNFITTSVMGNVTKLKIVSVSEAWNAVNDNIAGKFEFNICPNPVASDCNVSFNLSDNADVQFSVIGMNGSETKLSEHKMLQAGKNDLNFNLEGLAPGTYIARLKVGNEIIDRKILVR